MPPAGAREDPSAARLRFPGFGIDGFRPGDPSEIKAINERREYANRIKTIKESGGTRAETKASATVLRRRRPRTGYREAR